MAPELTGLLRERVGARGGSMASARALTDHEEIRRTTAEAPLKGPSNSGQSRAKRSTRSERSKRAMRKRAKRSKPSTRSTRSTSSARSTRSKRTTRSTRGRRASRHHRGALTRRATASRHRIQCVRMTSTAGRPASLHGSDRAFRPAVRSRSGANIGIEFRPTITGDGITRSPFPHFEQGRPESPRLKQRFTRG